MGIGENGHIAFNDPGVADFDDPLAIKKVALDEKCRNQQVHDGSVATTDRLVRTMVQVAGCSVVDAVKMMTVNPARFMGLSARKGTIAPGKDADIVLFDDDIRVSHVLVGGRRIV